MDNVYDVLIIGSGSAGLYLAARLCMPKIGMIEAGERVGKKLLATGNGKCNMFNVDMAPEHFNDPDGVREIISSYGYEQFIDAFDSFGLTTKDVGGRIYPYSESATSVLDVLRRAIAKNGVEVHTMRSAIAINKLDGIFRVDISEGDDGTAKTLSRVNALYANRVVLATGTNASFGRDSSGLLKSFGHTCKKFVPSLAPILTEREPIKGLNGVRVKAELELNGKREPGEILFKDFGVSGIAAMNLSAELARGRANIGDILHIDFAPDMGGDTLKSRLLLNARDGMTADDALTGLFHSKVKDRLLFASRVARNDSILSSVDRLSRTIKNFALNIVGIADKSLAQVNSGGVPLDEFDENLQSKYVERLYAVGEVLDVDGLCGGYNLGWAWASAERVARHVK